MKRWLPVVSVIALTGCAASPGDLADESAGAAEKVCIDARNIDSFDAIDDNHLYIRARGRQQHFLFTLERSCFGLQSAHTIGVRDALNRVCSNTFGEVVYRELGRGPQSCRIRNIESVAGKDDAAGLVEDRKEARREAGEKKKKGEE
ncbi:MAG: DUF6491 family protein [Woeseia sp.]